ncbi:MAG: cold shock domain-containing protein [Proteobacteria bacterium]|nr:cold shock domain-containing protein [Pseudomonadota bacterium]
MAQARCSISIVVNGDRWRQEGEALAAQNAVPRAWTLGGLADYARLMIGARLGHTFDQTELKALRWARSQPNDGDAQAVGAGFTVVTAPHISGDDSGAGLALDGVELGLAGCDVLVCVGSPMQWLPLRQKLEAAGVALFELLLPPTGKVLVSTERVIDLRELARHHHDTMPVSALFKPPPVVPGSAAGEVTADGEPDDSFAANAITGVVKSLAKGYGMITRRDGRGDVQFLSAHVAPPGFEFIEVGDHVRFDVVKAASGKWLAQRVVRA